MSGIRMTGTLPQPKDDTPSAVLSDWSRAQFHGGREERDAAYRERFFRPAPEAEAKPVQEDDNLTP